MQEEPVVRHWDDVERWLRDEAADCLDRRVIPRSMLVAFRDRRTALFVEGPEFCDESADAITDALCGVIHVAKPDQLLFVRTGVHRSPGSSGELFALRASLFERGRPGRHLAFPLLFDAPTPLVAAMPQRGDDPWIRRVRHTFDHPDERPEVVATEPPCEDDFLIAAPPPDGPSDARFDVPA